MFESLRRTRQTFFGRIANMLGATELDEDTWDDIEALLIQADLGIETAMKVTETLRKRVEQEGMTTRAQQSVSVTFIAVSMPRSA